MNSEVRPWGSFHTLHEDELAPNKLLKIKRIVVKPGKRLSLQYHKQRAEHWYCVQGRGVATIGDYQIEVWPGTSIDIMVNEKHRIECKDDSPDLVFIEVQTGTYLGEDDIVRLQDDYGR